MDMSIAWIRTAKGAQEALARIRELEAALREITRWKENQLDGIDSARIASAALETEAKFCNCGWPRTTDGEHGDNCPAKIEGKS